MKSVRSQIWIKPFRYYLQLNVTCYLTRRHVGPQMHLKKKLGCSKTGKRFNEEITEIVCNIITLLVRTVLE